MNSWLKKAGLALVLLGFLSIMVPLAVRVLLPATPILATTAVAL